MTFPGANCHLDRAALLITACYCFCVRMRIVKATLRGIIVRDGAHIRRTMMAQKKQAKKTGKGEHRKSSEYLRKGPKKK